MKPISEKTRQRIEEGLRNWDNPDSPARKRYEVARKKWEKVTMPMEDAIARSECLTAADFGIVINV